jgi:hypothetical protein
MIIFAVVAGAYVANLVVGPALYPQFSRLIGLTIFTLAFFAWLTDAIVMSVRDRLRARGK